eukprot:1485331-Pyramimonas_sp.AAC.1
MTLQVETGKLPEATSKIIHRNRVTDTAREHALPEERELAMVATARSAGPTLNNKTAIPGTE